MVSVLAIGVGLIAPLMVAIAVAGPDAGYAILMGTIAALSGCLRSGWARTVRVVPLLGVLGASAALVGYGWGWVIVMGGVGFMAGLGLPHGYLPALLYAGFVPTMVHSEPTTVRDAVLVGCFAVAGGAIGVAFGHRMGAKSTTPVTWRPPGGESMSAAVGMLLLGGGAAIAIATGLPHGYWIPLTLISVLPPMTQGDTRRARERLLGTIGALLIVIPVSFIPMPSWAYYALGFALFVPALAVMKRSYGYYAFLEAAAVVMLVSAGNDVLGAGEARVAAAVIAIGLIGITAVIVTWVLRRLPAQPAPAPLLAS